MNRVRTVFDRLLRRVQRSVPLRVTLHVAKPADFPAERSYAYCTDDHRTLRIYVAPKMAHAPVDRIEGVLRHEFGHAVFFHFGEVDHNEHDADKLAEALFGDPIRYDKADVQSIVRGRAPRPLYLPR